jgi:hypothetical protein
MSRLVEKYYAERGNILSAVHRVESGMIDSLFPCDYCSIRAAHNCNICSEYSRFIGKKVKTL